MFKLEFIIHTPWKQDWKSLWFKNFGRLSKHKCLEMQLMKENRLIGLRLDFINVFKGWDHAGPDIFISFLGYTFNIHIYDNRHWDYKNNCWEYDIRDAKKYTGIRKIVQ